VGADADITIYTPNDNKQTMFEMPRMVIQRGEIVIEDTELRSTPAGHTLHVFPGYDVAREAEIAEWFEKYYTVQFRNYPVSDDYLREPEAVACRT
jgi:formylmethanofuran dehydrogenase subunit A